ncbi:DUF2243 domain-containing protein [Halobacillus litoralis]|uniref:DUF2243 domain-containing protein n=1 Tax=Halobacillus litoralis TaxID=45668 RepID=UPI00136BA619|nr:DUF2243 domain-containing protein [Halobacillus litoralis]MYL39099.1 DUF2243 domain-containing protein [Halobacillus litoralis]
MSAKHIQPNRHHYTKRTLWSGLLFGIGLAAFIDETIFHQLLRWHHFYDQSTTDVGLISDGFFHAFSWFATIGGLFLFADVRRRNGLSLTRWWGGVLTGAGAFQLYDGIIQHKLMGLHQIRYVENILPYDLVWNISAVLMIITGVFLLKRSSGKGEIFHA